MRHVFLVDQTLDGLVLEVDASTTGGGAAAVTDFGQTDFGHPDFPTLAKPVLTCSNWPILATF